jgi:hypothetical protein
MGVYHKYEVICAVCDARFEANLVNSVNVSRFPRLKTRLLDRTLNRARCPTCGNISIIEKPFFYSDFNRRQFIAVYPRKERHFHARASAQARAVFGAFSALKYGSAKNSRVVFGLEELREKVVAADNDIDDRMLELLKLYVIKEHPFLIDRPRLRITLNAMDKERIEVFCTFDLERNFFKAYVPRAFLGTLQGTTAENGEPSEPHLKARRIADAAFAAKVQAPWVNLWSLNPSTDALSELSRYAEQIRAGGDPDPNEDSFKKMLRTLPAGNQLPGWAKRDIQTIAEYARKLGRSDIERRMFKLRFGFGIGDDWFKNDDADDVKTIWKLLEDLPDIAVEGNTWIKAIYIDKADDGGGSYDPSTKEISIGSDLQSNTNYFRAVVLHEVGHAVQAKFDRQKSDIVQQWLAKSYGWRTFGTRSRDVDAWIELMGGYPDGTTVQTKTQVRGYIQQSIGKGNTFEAAKIVNGPAGHLWNKESFGPRKAFALTGSDWYTRCGSWHLHSGKRFFVNYHYQELMVVDDATVKLIIHQMPDKYAAMSPIEFFAELFAWYYDAESPKRSEIPASVVAWLRKNVGPQELMHQAVTASSAVARRPRKAPRRRARR